MLKNFLISILILILLGLSVFVGLRTYKSKEKTFEFGGRQRQYRIHLPSSYDENKEYPMIIALHGLTFGPRIFELNTGLSSLADKEGFIVVYPYGSQPNKFIPYSWNSEFCCAYAYKENIDDVGFIASLLNMLREEYKVSGNKVYLTGHSNGAMLANYVALKHPDKVKALAVVSSAVGGKILEEGDMYIFEKSYEPVPILIINGRNDLVVPFDGGNDAGLDLYSFTSVYDGVNFWLENNSCNKHPAEISSQDNYTRENYNDCNNNAEVILYAHNGTHTWPGGAKDVIKNISGRSINASKIVWEFFKVH